MSYFLLAFPSQEGFRVGKHSLFTLALSYGKKAWRSIWSIPSPPPDTHTNESSPVAPTSAPLNPDRAVIPVYMYVSY